MEFADCNALLSFKIDPQFMKELHHELRALSTRRHQRSAGSGTSYHEERREPSAQAHCVWDGLDYARADPQ